MGKNIRKIQKMLSGEFGKKPQVGYEPERIDRKVGDIWGDFEGIKWEQRNGYKIKVSKLPGVGILGDQCSDCNKRITKGIHRNTYNRMGRCYHCQINFEVDLKSKKIGEKGNKWQFWVRLHELQNWISGRNELEAFIFQQHEARKMTYDMSVANAMANANVSMEIKNNS